MRTENSPLTPPVPTHLFGHTREHWLGFLADFYPDWEWHLGRRRLGDPHFRSEYPEFELVSQWQPLHGRRAERYAVYARWRRP